MKRPLLMVFIAALAALPLLPTPEFWITLANYVGVYAIIALGLVLLTGVGGMTSFGQAAFFGIGAYTTAYLCVRLGCSPWLGLLAGLALTAVCAIVLGLLTLRLSGHYLPLGTIAWGLSIYYLFGNLEALGQHDGLNGIPAIELAGVSLQGARQLFYLIWIVAVLCALTIARLLDSRPGRAMRAIRAGRILAQSMGVNTTVIRLLMFVIAALLAALAGWLFAHMQGSVNPTPFGLNAGIEFLFMAVIGGAGDVWGAVAGAFVLTLLKDRLQSLLPALLGSNGNFEVIVFGLLMIALLQRAPTGLWPVLRHLVTKRSIMSPKPNKSAAPLPNTAAISVASVAGLSRRVLQQAGSIILKVRGLRKEFGGLVANHDISFEMKAGEILAVIGPNGAGKSTLFNQLSGINRPSAGDISVVTPDGEERIDGMSAAEIARRGLSRSFQHVKLLSGMSVLDNVALGAHLRGRHGDLLTSIQAMLGLDRTEEALLRKLACEQIERVGLGPYIDQDAASLALGQQRTLEIARALCADPAILLLDEPAAGLRHLEKQALAALLRQLRAEGLSILLVEHDMDFVMNLSDRVLVMEFGTPIAEGTPAAIQNDARVLAAYLGEEV